MAAGVLRLSEHVLFECRFCRDRGVKTFPKPGYLEHKTSRISEGSKTTQYWVPGSHHVVSGCPHCGMKVTGVNPST
jgi:hypothetical protein